jgi:hypothetical protein
MASMEARLSLEGTESNLKHHRTDVTSDDQRKPRVTQSTPVKKVSVGGNTPAKTTAMSAANKAKQAAERLAAWQRRKNYDPLKAATNGKVQQVIRLAAFLLDMDLYKIITEIPIG